jgi:hypothetical protein
VTVVTAEDVVEVAVGTIPLAILLGIASALVAARSRPANLRQFQGDFWTSRAVCSRFAAFSEPRSSLGSSDPYAIFSREHRPVLSVSSGPMSDGPRGKLLYRGGTAFLRRVPLVAVAVGGLAARSPLLGTFPPSAS